MSIIGAGDVDGAVEPKTVGTGSEVDFIVADVEEREGDKGPYLLARLEIVNHPDAENLNDITHVMMYPREEDTPKQKNRSRWNLKQFCLAIGIDPAVPELEDMLGKTGRALVNESETDEYGKQNRVRKFTTE